MRFTDGPVLITAAMFVSLLFLDLFRHEYKQIPVHMVIGFFSLIFICVLCEKNSYLMAWILLLTPFIILSIGLGLYQHSMKNAPIYPDSLIEKYQPKNQPSPWQM
jgi:uncharacterized membrane protein YczE